MNPTPKTVYSQLFDEMNSNLVKTTSEFKLHSWRRKINQLENVDYLEYKFAKSFLFLYENKFELALEEIDSLIAQTVDSEILSQCYFLKAIASVSHGKYIDAIEFSWLAFEYSRLMVYYSWMLSTASNFLIYDKRLEDMKSFNQDQIKTSSEALIAIEKNIKFFNINGFNLNLYRDLNSRIHSLFFSNCIGNLGTFTEQTDSGFITILFNKNLDLEMIEKLNDGVNEIQLSLLDDYDFDDILRYPVVFTSEDYGRLI
ncbi:MULTISPECIES: hypothetical protein [Acinetobacter]|uniref:Uncharacterized protein n=2 Tax=Acinetobacter TaxID=469 RepID=N9DFI0_9GAMM|nr:MULTISPECIES: hypothetical protein [Acinetobacter]ENV79515.1 hypothetical protein F942_01823 [Acinetobacter ursingii ANC 3649]QXZ23290.1 hypothetical protein I6L31_00300 [Acinetobacter septicus]